MTFEEKIATSVPQQLSDLDIGQELRIRREDKGYTVYVR